MMRMRDLFALMLAALVAVTSLSFAVARGQAPVAGMIELCAGFGTTYMPLDAEGNPTGPAHVCPDGFASMASVGGFVAGLITLWRMDAAPLGLVRVVQAKEHVRPQARARAPPVVI